MKRKGIALLRFISARTLLGALLGIGVAISEISFTQQRCKVVDSYKIYLAKTDVPGFVAELTIETLECGKKKIRRGIITNIINCGMSCPAAITPERRQFGVE